MDITNTSPPPARLLDLSRLISRAGRPLTGVDRVELAYLRHLLRAGPLYGLVRSSFGYILLDPAGCAALLQRLTTQDWGPPDRLSRLKRRLDPLRARAEADLRRLCLDRCLPARLPRVLRRHLPAGLQYINTGHTNFTRRMIAALRGIDGARLAVMVHDTIPLDFPQYQRSGTVGAFRAFLRRAVTHADLILCNSHQTRADLHRHFPTGLPQTLVALLGVDPPRPGTAPKGPWAAPYFLCLGTIEPRKNHALLLDLWGRPGVGQDAPGPETGEVEDPGAGHSSRAAADPVPDPGADLLICGSRGWENAQVFARLDAGLPRVHELPGLEDGALFALLQGAAGLLLPSFAEGYGLPPIEAAALGVPILCNDLPVYREVLKDIPVYVDVADRYLWAKTITQMAADNRANRTRPDPHVPPDWTAHFKSVLTLI